MAADHLVDDHLSEFKEARSLFDDGGAGQNFCIAQIEELCANRTSDVSNEQFGDIAMLLYRSGCLSKDVGTFTKIFSLLQLKESSFFTAPPTLTDETCTEKLRQFDLLYECSNDDFEAVPVEIKREISMADIVRELGYSCTANTSHCMDLLSLFLPLDEVTLSKLLGTIVRTHIGLEDTQNAHFTFFSALDPSLADSSLLNSWNIDVLVDSIKLLAPKTNWTHVMENLDHEGFNIPDETAFSLLMSVYVKACQDPFPLHAICGAVWKNSEGQLSFLRHAVLASPDIFTFAHCSRKLTYVDTLLSNGHENRAWFCLDLLEVLCQLAERGYVSCVRLMLEHPINNCPEVLLAGIAQINTVYNFLQYEVASLVFPSILKDSTKSSIIHHLWRLNPNLVLLGFVDTHTDPNHLFRILDICQELKILSSVLETTPFPFSIKLAAIASTKEHINLEKWLNDNLNTYKDDFSEDCLKFLKEVLCDVANDVPDSSLQQCRASNANVYQETCSIFFKVLQAHPGQLGSHELFEELKRVYFSSNPQIQSNVPTVSAKPEGSSDDIEAEANAYFHQMFSGQLTIDAVIQMLARFKESSEKREQLIFECMIANLFEEYKFFPKYPEKQLKLAAVLFGSLIKHQLVTHLALGIALRGVLDALRKSVDSKMFVFGTKALEQFIDRLVEWPQYCNHILQISHLRGTHAELVSVIERALARVSSIQLESSGSNTLPADQPQAPTPTSVETMEASDASWQLMSSSSSQVGQQISPFQLQQRHQGFLGDRLKTTVTSENYTKPMLSNAGQSSLVSAPVDSTTSQKVTPSQSLQTRTSQHSASVTSAVSSSHGFVRPPRSITSAGMLRQPSYNTGFGAALNIETLVAAAERRDTPIEAPASEVQDKILFMINNISTSNMETKAKEFTEVIKEQYYPWFAQYMVMKRASIEPNFHDLYLKFLDKVNSRSLNKEIVKATYENCKVLLRSDLIKSSSEERSLLKNLGSWLGKFTIGRNQALLAKEIDPKVLIMEAYEKGLMIAVIPFTSKILEPCQCSLAYQPPNPWTMGILGLLTEIYNLPNLKMNLKFDIEVLFKNLCVDMKDVKPASLLKDRVREVEGNPDFSNKDVSASQPPVIAEVNSGIMPTLNQVELQPDVNNTSHPSSHPNVLTQYSAPLHLTSNAMAEDDKVGALIIPERVPSGQGLAQVAPSAAQFSLSQLLTIMPDSDSYININPKLSSMGPQMQFHRIIQVAMDRAIREIVSPVITRSVTIALRTTMELVSKDYAMESDDNVIFRAARLMVGTLAGSLAHVTCKEPLRAALLNHLRSVLQTLNVNSERSEQIVQILTTDHLDLGCAVIENVASQKAVELIDGEMAPSFASIKKQRDLSGSAYYVAGTYAQGPLARLPEALRPKPGHLSEAQQRVYNDFIRNIWQNQPSQIPNAVPAAPPGMGSNSVNSAVPRVYGTSTGQLNSSIFSTSQVAPGFSAVPQQVDLIPEESDRSSTQVLSVPSAHVGTNDGVMQPNVENSSIAASFPAVTSAELHSVEASTVLKESGALVPPSPSTSGAERLGTVLSESLLTTGDALDKYQHMAQKVSLWFDDWCQLCDLPTINDTAYSHYISQLQQNGWLKGDDVTDRFFRILTVLSVSRCLATEQVINPGSLSLQSTLQLQHLSYFAIDAYAKLVVLVLKYCSVDQGSSKLFLLPEILSVTVRVIQKDAEDKKSSFNPRPYFRLFVNWLLDLASPDPVLDGANFQVLTSFANAFHALQPLKVPGWSFAWLELVSHRSFMPKLLTSNTPKGWPFLQRLLVDLFKFMEPYLRNAEMGEPVHFLYKGTLRVLLVLLHDFPEFLCDYHFSFCDVIPPSCIQMRNLILSAFPRNMRLPDPSTPNLKIDLLAEISQSPRILSDVDGALKAKQIKADIDEYLKTRAEGSFLSELKQRLLLPPSEAILAGTHYNVPLINSLVLYVGMQGIQKLQSKSTQHAQTQQMTHCSPMDISLADGAMDIFPSLIKNLDTEGRYLFLNAIANQLRYPNNHTHFFSFVLLYLFAEASQDIIQEQITRVLLERLIVNRPHPWGLLITFIELIKNPRYSFWNRSFTRCAPEIEKLFESVSRSCGGPKTVDDGMVSSGIADGNH